MFKQIDESSCPRKQTLLGAHNYFARVANTNNNTLLYLYTILYFIKFQNMCVFKAVRALHIFLVYGWYGVSPVFDFVSGRNATKKRLNYVESIVHIFIS